MIVMDFFINRMPGMLDELSILITYQIREKEWSIALESATEMWKGQKVVEVAFESLPTDIILPGL